MSGGTICVARELPIDAALVGTVLGQLRRDTLGSSTAWTLGDRGSAEVDVDFFPVISSRQRSLATNGAGREPGLDHLGVAVGSRGGRDRARGRRGERGRHRLVRADDPARSAPRPVVEARAPALLDLAQATIDELAEEMLWHASANERHLTRSIPTRDNPNSPNRRISAAVPQHAADMLNPGRGVAARPPAGLGRPSGGHLHPPPVTAQTKDGRERGSSLPSS